MGFLSGLLSAAAPVVGSIFGGPVGGALGGAVGGLLGGKDAPSSQTSTTQQQLDPRLQQILFGANGSDGLLGNVNGYLNKPQDGALQAYGNANLDYLKNNGASDLGAIHGAADTLLSRGISAPQIGAAQAGGVMASLPAYAVGGKVNAPSQNSADLSGAYDRFINGTPGANQYLDQGINGAIAQNRLGFQQMQDDSTQNLLKNILPSIRSGAIAAGQYGGSRQGIAEGNAIGQQQQELARAASQFGQNATNAAVGAKANAYETDSNRALSATQGLGAQQYGVAQADAASQNAAQFLNVGNSYDVSKTNAGLAQQTNLANMGAQNQANLSNQGATLQTNALNTGGLTAGAGLLGGLNSQAYGVGTNQDSYGLNQAGKVAGILGPFMGANASSSSTQPLYQNTAGNVLGGALAGSQLSGLLGGSGYSPTGSMANMNSNTSSLANFAPSSGSFDWNNLSKLIG